MPIQNEIVVEIDGKQHKQWKSYDIDSDFLIPADAFSFELGMSADQTRIPDFSGKTVQVRVNGTLVLTGIVDSTHHILRKGERSYRLNGRDKASLLVDCSAPMTNVKGLSVLDAVKKIVQPLGVEQVVLRAEKNPTLDKVDIDVGETAWEAIMRCANSAGLHCWFEPDGVLVVGGADYRSEPVATLRLTRFGEHNNISHVELERNVAQRFSEVTFLGQKHGREGDKNKNDLKWVYQDPTMPIRKPKTVVLGDVENLEALQKQARKQLSDWQLEGFDLKITVPDHKTENGVLWMNGQRVHIVLEEYEIDDIFFLMGRRFTLSRQGGTQTELRFKQDGVWTPDAYQASAEQARHRHEKSGKKGRRGRKKKDPLESINLALEK